LVFSLWGCLDFYWLGFVYYYWRYGWLHSRRSYWLDSWRSCWLHSSRSWWLDSWRNCRLDSWRNSWRNRLYDRRFLLRIILWIIYRFLKWNRIITYWANIFGVIRLNLTFIFCRFIFRCVLLFRLSCILYILIWVRFVLCSCVSLVISLRFLRIYWGDCWLDIFLIRVILFIRRFSVQRLFIIFKNIKRWGLLKNPLNVRVSCFSYHLNCNIICWIIILIRNMFVNIVQ